METKGETGRPWLKQIIGYIRRIPLRFRLLAVFLIVSIVPVVCIGVYSYQVYTASIQDKLEQSSQQATFLLNRNLINQLEKFSNYTDAISVANDIQSSLALPPTEPFVRDDKVVMSVSKLITVIPFQSKYLKNIRVVDRSHNIIFDLGYDDISKERFDELLAGIERATPRDSLERIKTYRAYDKIVLGRKIYNIARPTEHIGYIMIYIDEKLISEEIFSDVTFGPGSNLMLIDANGTLISSQDRSLLSDNRHAENFLAPIRTNLKGASGSFPAMLNDTKHLINYYYNATYNTYLVATIPYTYITNETKTINAVLIALAIGVAAACLILTFLVYLSVTKPINKMIDACNATADEDIDIAIGDRSTDELGFLARTIDSMVTEIRQLALRWQADQARKRELELQMLQYQINPHFLFNTLNSLKWTAVLNDVPVLEQGINALSALLQSTLVNKNEFIPLREETDNLRHYFMIQKIRYGNSFDVKYLLSPDTLERLMPRFILQPLAENAVIHGTEHCDNPILITVESHLDAQENLIITLSDNGSGFDTNEPPARTERRSSGIGLNNVQERLRLYFTDEYGLRIESQPRKGTQCIITIPRSGISETI